jgi:hypothetical protein
MKKILLLAIVVAIANFSFGQDDNAGSRTIKGSKEITKAQTPQQVIDSLKAHFPNADAVHYYQTNAATAKGWSVTTDDNLLEENAEASYYTIKFKRKDFQYFALFRANGSLVRSEFQLVDVALPAPVVATLKKLGSEKYKGYMIVSKSYWKETEYDKVREFYVVRAVKKDNYKVGKTVCVDAAGNVVYAEE